MKKENSNENIDSFDSFSTKDADFDSTGNEASASPEKGRKSRRAIYTAASLAAALLISIAVIAIPSLNDVDHAMPDPAIESNENATATHPNPPTNAPVSISTACELLNNIADNTKISLSTCLIDFDNTFSVTNSYVEKTTESNCYTISSVENLVIEGETATILVTAKNFDFGGLLSFNECKNVVFKNIVFKTESKKQNDWYLAISFSNCQNITFENCYFDNLSMCFDIARTSDFSLNNCKFKNVSYTTISLCDAQNILVDNCTFKNTGDVFHSTRSSLFVKESTFEDIEDSSIFCDDLYDYTIGSTTTESEAIFENCTFRNNNVLDFFNKSTHSGDYNFTYEYDHDKVKFHNCLFSDNVYVKGNFNNLNYIDCTFNNNSIGVEIPNITNWGYDENTLFLLDEELNGINYSIEYVYDEDITSNLVTPTFTVVSQSKVGVVTLSDSNIVITIAKPAITLDIDWVINSTNGVVLDVKITNNTDKQIAYVYFTIKYYDRMGNPAYCSIKDICQQTLKATGPISAGDTETAEWGPSIYNNTISAIKPLSIEVVFKDGTKQIITNTGGYWYSNRYYGGDLHD